MSGVATAVATVAILAPFCTKMVDLVRNAVDQSNSGPKVIWVAMALVIGLVMALVFQVNVLASLGPTTKIATVTGEVLTGFAIAGWSSGFHELFAMMSGISKRTTT